MLKLALFLVLAFLVYRLVKQIGGRSGQSRESSDPARRASRYDGTKIVDAEYEDLDGKDGGE